jgi:hypothetical protein
LSISVDGLGNVYTSGYTQGSLDGLNAGQADAFVSKYDAAGNLQWTKQLGTETYDVSEGVSADVLGDVYITGHNSGRVFLSKLDFAGALQWSKQLGDFEERQSLSVDGLGNVYISGSTNGDLGGPNAGHLDAYVAKYDASGNHLWTSQYGTSGFDVSQAVSADAVGNVYLAGYIDDKPGPPGSPPIDAFVSKFDEAGVLQWTRRLVEASSASHGVASDGLGNVYISGTTAGSLGGPNMGSTDVFLIKYDAAGDLQWSRQIGTHTGEAGGGVSADGLGNVYIAGSTGGSLGGPNAGSADPFIAKYNDCPECPPSPIPPIVVDVVLAGEIQPGSSVSHQFTTSFGNLPISWSNLAPSRATENLPTLSETGLFSWQTTKLDAGGLYHFDVTATNAGGSDVGRLTLRLAIIPEPSAIALLALGIGTSLFVPRARRRAGFS